MTGPETGMLLFLILLPLSCSLHVTLSNMTFTDLPVAHLNCSKVCSIICGPVTPANCSVFGSGMYASPSTVCCAAYHDGVLESAGGRVDFTAVAGQASFTGSYRNNLRSDSYEYDKEETHVGYYFQKEVMPYPVITEQPQGGNLSDEPTVALSCSAMGGSEECVASLSYSWTRNGKVVEGTTTSVYQTDEEGVYSCTAWCDVSGVRSGVISDEATVAYTKSGKVKEKYIVQGYILEEGGSIPMPCTIQPIYQNGAEVLNNRLLQAQRINQTISALKTSTPGVYQCGKDVYFVSHSVPVNITGVNIKSVTIKKNTGVVLNCMMTGYPLPFMSWLHDSVPLTSTYRATWGSNSALMLNYAEMETSGNYQCYNGGLMSESIQVNITADNKITKLKADKDAYIVGDSMTILCTYEVEGEVKKTLKWLHNSTSLEGAHSVESDGAKVYTEVVLERGNARRYETRLEMANVSLKHAGMYEAELFIDGKDQNKYIISAIIVPKIRVRIEGEVFPPCDRFDNCNMVDRKTKHVKKNGSNNTYIGKVTCFYKGTKAVKNIWMSKGEGIITENNNDTGLKYSMFVNRSDEYACKGCNSWQCVQSDWVSIKDNHCAGVTLSVALYICLIVPFL